MWKNSIVRIRFYAHVYSEITYRVGYGDIAFFRKVFVRLTGLRPKAYQRRFQGYAAKSPS
jgi:YesN/AraC family two-component response regulator